MKETYNWKSLFAGVVILLVGTGLCIASAYSPAPWNNILLSTGCSLIASGLVILMHDFFVERKQVSLLDEWAIKTITSTRAEINSDCEIELEQTKRQVDIVAFGLSSFRSKQTDDRMLGYLKKGVNFRILTMNPSSKFIAQRVKEENNKNIKNSINTLVDWADKLNKKNAKGKIIVKGYDTMTLDFYWRSDNVLYVGPYWYGRGSQQTITYKYLNGGKGFKLYTEHFNELWNNTQLTKNLTKETDSRKRGNS
ncbi:MAG: hypothetical protein IKC51_11205 [Myxococcaceae bacterium]|nr:hypothetical protein [Myxococcaceae bacterium]